MKTDHPGTTWLVAAFASGLLASPALAASFTLSQTLDNPAGTPGASFGRSVAIDGDAIVVGAPNDLTAGRQSGQAYLFSGADGSLQQTFTNQGAAPAFDEFGGAVAISGDNIVIGAPQTGVAGQAVGRADLFSASTGALLRTFNDPTISGGDQFGASVSVSGDNVLIGAPGDTTAGAGTVGQAHLFSASTGALLRTFDDPAVAGNDQFGFSVAIDGDNVLIGAAFDGANGPLVGQAYLFSASTGALLQTFNDPTPTFRDQFGFSVAISGDNALIGAPFDDTNGGLVGQAHLFSASTGALLRTFDDPTPTVADQFGTSVAISGDNALIGANQDDTDGGDQGQAYLFSASTGALLQTFSDPTPTGTDNFGRAVAISGSNAVVGADFDNTVNVGSGQAVVFSAPPEAEVPLPAGLPLYLGALGVFGLLRWRRTKA